MAPIVLREDLDLHKGHDELQSRLEVDGEEEDLHERDEDEPAKVGQVPQDELEGMHRRGASCCNRNVLARQQPRHVLAQSARKAQPAKRLQFRLDDDDDGAEDEDVQAQLEWAARALARHSDARQINFEA